MPATILSVDDNEAHSYAMARMLEHAGYKVLRASTGSRALKVVMEHKPDAVLLDINLPDINGYEVCQRIKTASDTRHIPVIFHTATDATAGARSHAELVGAAAFLTYPIQRDHLLTVLRGTLAGKDSSNGTAER